MSLHLLSLSPRRGAAGARRLRAAGLALALVVGLAGCSRAPEPAETPPRPVRTLQIQPRAVQLVGEFPAEIRSARETSQGFQVGGRLVSRPVQTGDVVAKGDVLASLDPQDLKLAETASAAELNAAEVALRQAEADLARTRRLEQSGFISAAEAQRQQANHDAARARAAQARAGLQAQRNQSGYATLRADVDGVVTATLVEPGQVVAAGQPVVQVAARDTVEAAFQVPEQRLAQVRALGRADVVLWADGTTVPGTLRELAGRADPSTRAFPARVSLDQVPEGLQFGMTATVRFVQPLARPLVQVPLTALLQRDGKTWVWLLTEGSDKVQRVPVQVLTVSEAQALLAEPLPAGAEVVTAGTHLLADGQQVRRLETVVPPADAGPVSAAMLPGVTAQGLAPAAIPTVAPSSVPAASTAPVTAQPAAR